jgi:hypothetical protein
VICRPSPGCRRGSTITITAVVIGSTAAATAGILTVTVPRAQRAQPTRIAVKTGVEHPKLVEAHAATV